MQEFATTNNELVCLQSDIFDHILAVAPEFELRVYQSPSGGDLLSAAERIRTS